MSETPWDEAAERARAAMEQRGEPGPGLTTEGIQVEVSIDAVEGGYQVSVNGEPVGLPCETMELARAWHDYAIDVLQALGAVDGGA